MCKFDLAWRGQCKDEPEKDFCSEHDSIKCCSCGEKATRECCETMQFVCGFPLCDTCEHTIRENGCNSGAPLPDGVKGHCKPEEQVYEPWYMNTNKEE